MRFIGFDLTNLGNNSYAINGLPAGVENLDPVSLIRNMVDRAIETGCEVHEEICDSLALSLAKAAAIRPGKILSGEEMDDLLASLFSCQESNLTPDGKTIVSKLTDEELVNVSGDVPTGIHLCSDKHPFPAPMGMEL